MNRRFSVVLAFAVLMTAGLVILSSGPAAAASKTWTSDTDFAGGTFLSTEVVGTGPGASIQLQEDPTLDWINMAPVVAPSPRRGPALTYDEVNNVVMMFGGVRADGTYSNETWRYNTLTNAWTNVTPATSPPARWKGGLSYDPIEQVAVLYGGRDAGGQRTDLWEYNVNTGAWASVTPPPPTPRPLDSTPLTYDSVVDRHILVGNDPIGGAMETWGYNAAANTWTNFNPVAPPESRNDHTLTFDRSTLKNILFGGGQGLVLYGDVWEYNSTANTWVKVLDWIQDVTPNKRIGHAMTFGPNGAVSLMFGGVDEASAYQPETWYFIDFTILWISPPVGTAPGGRRDHAFAWDADRDVTVMFGGQLSTAAYTNQTWVWGRGYYNSGTYESAVYDAGCLNPDWIDGWWNATTPATTNVRFKIASSDAAGGPWIFTGFDGLPGTFYSTPGTAVHASHDGNEFFRFQATLTTGDAKVTPALHDYSVNFICPAQNPRILTTSPANGDTNVPLNADIVVTFSEPMDTPTVTWTISGGITLSGNWNTPTDTILTLTHATDFQECTLYTVEITGGQDQNEGLPLVAGPVPNPWSFTTACINPFIVSTVPADGDIGVAVTAPLVVTFSEPMNTTTVTWTITGGITLSGSWNTPTDTILTLTHATPFAQCTVYTAEITAGLDTADLPLGPGPVPNPWSFTTTCPNPFIVSTSPADGETGVALSASIIVDFSAPINRSATSWTIAPTIALTETWNPTDTQLILSHGTLFNECTLYTVEIINPDLVPGPVPNPWNFTTICIAPFIASTVPADGATGVALNAPLVVTFSEPMDTPTVTWTITGGITLGGTWDPTDTTLTLAHGTLFAQCTDYTAEITAGDDKAGVPLGPGPAPNPWTFTTTCPLSPPPNLRATIQAADVLVAWDPAQGAISYRVYSAANRFATFPAGWSLLGSPTGTTFTATGHGGDGGTHYYVVRSVNLTAESANSTMGVKTQLSFAYSAVNTNIAWFSLPHNSIYTRASDIATALGPTNIDVVGKWDPARQSSVTYYYARNRWRGTDFTIGPGDGLYLGVRQNFVWAVAGTDRSVARTFTLNGPPMPNVNWVGVPYTGVYDQASEIANELTSSKIVEIGLWDAATQSAARWYWTGTMWTGTDFTFTPGAGIYVIIASSFTWTPLLITPTVP